MSVRIVNGTWLFVDGNLANSAACCCGGLSCCGFSPENCTLTVTVTDGPSPGTYEWDFATNSWVGAGAGGALSFNPADCTITYTEADSPYLTCISWSASVQASLLCQECCANDLGVSCELTGETFTSTQDGDCAGQIPTNMTLALNCQGSTCCGGPCLWQPVWLLDGTWGGGWEMLSGFCNAGCSCPEPDVEGVGTEEAPAQEAPYETPCSADAAPLSLSGPGTELKALLATFGITAGPKCKCNEMAQKMNAWGPSGSLEHIEEIVDSMEKAAKARRLPFLRAAGRKLVQIACRRAARKMGDRGIS